MSDPLLSVADLRVRYGGIEALRGITLDVEEGELVSLIGGNGAGKSTTLRTISGLKRPMAGTVSFRGKPIHKLPAHEIVRLGICQVPEGRQIFPRMSVAENLEMGAYARRADGRTGDDLDRVFELFPPLKERRTQAGGTLSGGEQQMLAIGRALMSHPTLLMLDEPSLGLSPLLTQRIFELLREIHAQGTTILLVEQNANQALRLADRGYVIESGEITLQDRGDRLLGNDAVRKAYLGEA
jgi:branched-chain amino acid transport system ATP-binding protein